MNYDLTELIYLMPQQSGAMVIGKKIFGVIKIKEILY